MIKLTSWLILITICGGFWSVVIYFAADVYLGISLPTFKAFGLGVVFFFFLVGLKESLKVVFEK